MSATIQNQDGVVQSLDKASLLEETSQLSLASQDGIKLMMNEKDERLTYFKVSVNKPLRLDVIFVILAILFSLTATAMIFCLPYSIKDSETG